MMHGNGRPLGMRKRMQVVVAVVLLAWATQTLLHQWGYGAEIPQGSGETEKFVPGTARFAAGATLEMRGDATILGSEVKLKQVCRWSNSDGQVFLPVADLVVARIGQGSSPFRAITIDQIRSTLHDAGMNLAIVKFAGPISCTVTRSDATYDEQTALRLWAEAKEVKENEAVVPTTNPAGGNAEVDKAEAKQTIPAGASIPAASDADGAEARTLRVLLIDDLSVRLGIAKEKLQVTFNPADEKLLTLAEPLFKFNIEPRHVRDLGEVSWNVQILSGRGTQKGTVTATARAWQNEIVLNKPVSYQQVIQGSDFAERKVLCDRLPGDTLLNQPQVLGQQASRDLPVGTVLNARMVDAVPLVKPGQLVTVTLTVGSVQVKTVGRALEGGAYGQTVKVRNETTRDVFEVVMIAPQQGTMDPIAPAKVAAVDPQTR